MISALTENERTVTGMAEYIEREALRDSVESIDWYSVYRGKLTTGANSENALYKANDIYSAIDNAPAADVAPVRHGRWLPQVVLGQKAWDCSECKTLGSPHWKWCPVCGAMMDLEDTNG